MDDHNGLFKWILGFFSAALVGLYGFFIRHVYQHVSIKEIHQLWDQKQDKSACEQIVKRIDGNHQESCKKLDRILDLLEKRSP